MDAANRSFTFVALGVLMTACLLAAVRLSTTAPARAPPVEPVPAAGVVGVGQPLALFVLGDSLSDVGNAAALSDYLLGRPFYPEHAVGLCNPVDVYLYGRGCGDLFYRQSRVSDGPLAVEHLAAYLGLPLDASFHTVPERPGDGTDYAVASAKAAGAGPEDLTHQVDRLLVDAAPLLPSDALFVVMIGGNDGIDALQAASEAVSPEAASEASEAIVAAAVDAIAENVARLMIFGARRIIVANLPDLAALPAVRASAAALGGSALETAAALVQSFNQRLDERLAAVAAAHPDAAVIRFDLYSVVQAAVRSGERNGTEACFDSLAYRANWTAERIFHEGCAPPTEGAAPRFAGFFFWDGLHPTGAAHALIGEALIGTYVASAASIQR